MENSDKKNKLKNNLWFGYIVFLILWSGCVYTELGRWNQKHELFARIIDKHPYVSDFVNVYNSASLAAACQKEKIDIYSPELQNEYAKKLIAPVVPEQPFYLQYPPFLFTVVRPLALFDMLGAWLVWCSMGMALLVASAVYLTKSAALTGSQAGKFTRAFVIAATVASFPTWYSIELGQTSLLLVPGLVAFWLLCQKRKYFLAGLASGVVLIKLQYLPPIFLIGFVMGTWPFLGGFTLIGLLLLALSIFTLGIDNVLRFPQALLKGENSQGVSGVAADQMQNIRGSLTLILGSDNAMVHIISIGAFALALALLAFFWWRASKTWWRVSKSAPTPVADADNSETTAAALVDTDETKGMCQFRLLASISTLILLVVSPHCHTQDYLALVVPCIWLWFEVSRLIERGDTSKDLRLLQSLIIAFPFLGWPFFVLKIFFQLAKIQPFFLWAVIVIILSYRVYARMPRQIKD